MSINKTPRMKLVTESDDEIVDPFAANWPILDSYAGALKVADGVTPDPATLFDGSVIYEATSGISWMADLSSGSLVKRYLTYPFLASAEASFVMSSAVDGNIRVPLSNPNAYPTVNWDKVLVSNQIKLPIRGIYYITGTMRDAHSTGNGTRSMAIALNGNPYGIQNEMLDTANNGYTFLQTAWLAPFDKDVLIALNAWQNGPPGSADFALTVELISPIW